MKTSPCCNAPIAQLSSVNKRMCSKCAKVFDWKLKDGVQSVLTKRVGGRDER